MLIAVSYDATAVVARSSGKLRETMSIVTGKTTPTPPPISIMPTNNGRNIGKIAMVSSPTKITSETKSSVLFAPNREYRCAVAYENNLATPKALKRKPIRTALTPIEFAVTRKNGCNQSPYDPVADDHHVQRQKPLEDPYIT